MFVFWVPSSEGPAGLLRYTKLLKIARVVRMIRIFRFARLSRVLSRLEYAFILRQHVMQAARFVLLVVLICHVFACVFYAIAASGKRDGEYRKSTWIVKNNLAKRSRLDKYVAAFYWTIMTVTTVGFGDIAAASTVERIYGIFVMMVGATIFAIGTAARERRDDGLKDTRILNKLERESA